MRPEDEATADRDDVTFDRTVDGDGAADRDNIALDGLALVDGDVATEADAVAVTPIDA